MWELPGPGMEPVSPALVGRFFTTEPSGKPSVSCLRQHKEWERVAEAFQACWALLRRKMLGRWGHLLGAGRCLEIRELYSLLLEACSSWTRSWHHLELVRQAASQSLPQTYWLRTHIATWSQVTSVHGEIWEVLRPQTQTGMIGQLTAA